MRDRKLILMRLRRNSKPFRILKALLIGGGFLVISAISPQGGANVLRGIIGDYFRNKRLEKEKLLRDLRSLQSRELVDFRELPSGRIKITLTKQGRQKILLYDIDNIKLKTKDRWDGRWRLVIFDIPHQARAARDALRQKLNSLGFYHIQKSVFITPYKCEDEVDFICSVFDVRKHVLIFEISRFEGETKLRKHFKL